MQNINLEKSPSRKIKIKGLETQFFDRNADRNLTGKICIGSQYF